ncbi:MAG: hypothetical protein Q9215_002552 [Flavoplaca cf. flavocitrina]
MASKLTHCFQAMPTPASNIELLQRASSTFQAARRQAMYQEEVEDLDELIQDAEAEDCIIEYLNTWDRMETEEEQHIQLYYNNIIGGVDISPRKFL